MNRSIIRRNTRLASVFLLTFALFGCMAAPAQTDTPLTPAQQKAQAAREARQAAQQQAAQNRAAAAQARATAAQNRAANKTSANSTAPNTAANSKAGTIPGSNTKLPAAQRTSGASTVGSGTLAWQTRVYSSTGCAHNGNSAVCTFTFTNQGNEATLVAGAELSGVQLVDDAHVPHRANAAHFLDKYGTQQPRLLVQPGDTGTYVVTFPDVNSQVTSGDFHLRQQIVGGVTFTSSSSASASVPQKASPGAAVATPK